MDKKTIIYKIICAVVVIGVAVLLLSGLLNKGVRTNSGPLTGEDVKHVTVKAPEETAYDGTIKADAWQAAFPEITLSMKANKDNAEIIDYLEQDPYLVSIYEGFGFAKEYGSARGHEYTLEDVHNTARPHATANCLTCKTPNFAKMVQDKGVSVYTEPFDEVWEQIHSEGENVSCYTCHGNDAGNGGALRVTHTYVDKALTGDALSSINPATLSCGQCHIEYYFTPTDKETMMPYKDVESMTPEAILAYYDAMVLPDGTVGFSDWTQESTGAKLLKAQHPEFETYLLGKHASDLSCADCHMEVKLNEDGTVYHSHELVSPLDSEAILATCVRCHGDTNMVQKVRRIQDSVTTKERLVGENLAAFKEALADANKAAAEGAVGAKTEEQLTAVRKVYREAQWFFDFCYVENAEGAHNSELAFRCLDLAQARIDVGMELLSMDPGTSMTAEEYIETASRMLEEALKLLGK